MRKGDLAAVLEQALDLLIDKVRKERFGVGRKPRPKAPPTQPGEGQEGSPPVTRHIPDEIKRQVYERDAGQCAYVSADGRRCSQTRGLELDHLDGFAIKHEHSAARIRLACSAHNAQAAEKMYGREKMAQMRQRSNFCPGAEIQTLLL